MQNINKQAHKKDNKKIEKRLKVEKHSDDYCIIEGNKIEGNACSTILNED